MSMVNVNEICLIDPILNSVALGQAEDLAVEHTEPARGNEMFAYVPGHAGGVPAKVNKISPAG